MDRLSSPPKLTPEEAFVALAIVAVAVDGEHAEAEEMAVTQAILSADLFASHPADQLITMINNSFNYINEQGIDTMFQSAIGNLPDNLRSEAVNAVAKIVMADGKISSEEKELLNNLGQAFNLSEEQINQTLERV